MKIKNVFCITSILLLTACGSKFKKDYILIDASDNKMPKWAKKSVQKPTEEFKFFVSKADNVNQRLCESSASARASAVVASEISQKLNNNYKEITESKDLKASAISEEKLEQNISLFLAGIQKEETYWEKRKYSTELGADADVVKFQCYTLIKIDQTTYKKALERSIDKMLELTTHNKSEKEEIKDAMNDTMVENNVENE